MSRVRLKRIIKKIYIPLPGLAPPAAHFLLLSFVSFPPPLHCSPVFFVPSLLPSPSSLSGRSVCLSVFDFIYFGLQCSRMMPVNSCHPCKSPRGSVLPSHLPKFPHMPFHLGICIPSSVPFQVLYHGPISYPPHPCFSCLCLFQLLPSAHTSARLVSFYIHPCSFKYFV